MKTSILVIILAFISFVSAAQTERVKAYNIQPETPVSFPKQSNYLVNESRKPMYLPYVDGYVLLKADLHMHTVFSDGSVWPRTRVEEAFREGIDIIAITDHLEFHYINQDKVNSKDLNMEYNIAKDLAKELGILLIPGAEVTREVPAGHYNILFLDNANNLEPFINPQNPRDTLTLVATLKAAKDLGCFITWNHPAYQNPQKIAEWGFIHQHLYDLGLMDGIEIVNSNMYIPLVQQWAMAKGLTMLSSSDLHSSSGFREGQHRPVTIIFAKDRSIEAIKEALFAGRTVGYSCNYLYGKEEFVKPMFQNSIKSRVLSQSEKSILVELRNTSGIPFEMEFLESENLIPAPSNRTLVIYPSETLAVKFLLKKIQINQSIIKVLVNNIHINAEQPLITVINPFSGCE